MASPSWGAMADSDDDDDSGWPARLAARVGTLERERTIARASAARMSVRDLDLVVGPLPESSSRRRSSMGRSRASLASSQPSGSARRAAAHHGVRLPPASFCSARRTNE